MVSLWDQNLSKEVLIQANPLKKMELDYWKQHSIMTPFMKDR